MKARSYLGYCLAMLLWVVWPVTAAETNVLNWSPWERATLRSLSLSNLSPLGPVTSNRVADSAAAAAFGRQLFFDRELTPNAKIACADCHQPARFFTDGEVIAQGVRGGGRNTPSLLGTGYQDWWYWDGRRDSLWSQALTPMEADNEMAGDRLAITRRIAANLKLRARYQRLFGEIPPLLLDPDLPDHASPLGTTQEQTHWQQLSTSTQEVINQLFANLGKAIAAYQRTLMPPVTPFDRFVEELAAAEPPAVYSLSLSAQQGARLFMDDSKTHCLRCHNGPLLSNGTFHNIGSGNYSGKKIDVGRLHGLPAVIENEFNCLGPYSDAKPHQCEALRFLDPGASSHSAGAFKTPSLRNLTKTAPYFHDGRFRQLREVLQHYRQPPMGDESPPHELIPTTLNDEEVEQLLAFLNALSPR